MQCLVGLFHQFVLYNLVFGFDYLQEGFVLVCPENFVKCPTGARLECIALNEAIHYLSCSSYLWLSTLPLLLSYITI